MRTPAASGLILADLVDRGPVRLSYRSAYGDCEMGHIGLMKNVAMELGPDGNPCQRALPRIASPVRRMDRVWPMRPRRRHLQERRARGLRQRRCLENFGSAPMNIAGHRAVLASPAGAENLGQPSWPSTGTQRHEFEAFMNTAATFGGGGHWRRWAARFLLMGWTCASSILTRGQGVRSTRCWRNCHADRLPGLL